MAEREGRGGYTGLRDMFDGGGPGRSGSQFEGGGVLSSIGNAMGGPAAFSFGGDDSTRSRGATIGRTVGGMMFGPLGMIGGGILGNMIGRGRGSAQAPRASMTPTQRPSPAMVAAMPPSASTVPMQRPFAPTDAAVPAMPTMPSVMGMPGAVERFIAQYGTLAPAIPNTIVMDPAAYTPPALPGAVPMSQPPMMSGGVDQMGVPLVGYLPRVAMPVDPMIDPRNMVSLPVDRMTGRPMAMTPPRLQ